MFRCKHCIQNCLKEHIMALLGKIFLSAVPVLAIPLAVAAQCWSGSYGGPLSPVPGPVYQVMPVTTGEYYDFTVPNTCIPTYDFSFCAADGGSAAVNTQITVLNSTGTVLYDFNDDFCGTQSHLTWTPPAGGTYIVLVNSSWCNCCSGPDPGILAFRAVPPPPTMFLSCTVAQASSSPVTLCDADQEILRIEVNLTNSNICGNFTLDQVQLNMNGSTIPGTNANDVNRLHLYYTGNSPVMQAANEYLPGGFSPAPGTMTLNGSQPLLQGTNYFWLCYDICTTNGTISNVVDGECVQLTVNGIPHTPTVTAPAGSRSIAGCPAYPTVGNPNFRLWLNASAGVTVSAGQATQWNDISGAGVTGNFTVQPAAPWLTPQTPPTYSPALLNGNPGISFDGISNSLASINQFSGNSLFHPNNNTIVSVVDLKWGIVWYKWETNPWVAYRVGYETNGNSMRFDFVDDVAGKNNQSVTNIAQKPIILGTTTDPVSTAVSFNANTDGIKNITGLSFTPDPAELWSLALGNNELTVFEHPSCIDMFELLQFSQKLSNAELRLVQSYLAVKYGITLGNNRNTGTCVPYYATDGTPVWYNKQGYHNYVIGIGRDDVSTLNQLKSTSTSSLNGSTDILTISNGTNFASPSSFAVNKSYFICGNNKLLNMSTASSMTDVPPGIVTRLERVWQAQETGTVGTITLEFDMSTVPGPNNLNDVRLLVSQTSSFAPPATVIILPSFVTGTTVRFQYDFTPASGYYFTIGSVDWGTAPLPVSMVDFTARCKNGKTELLWKTESETNNYQFTIARSIDGGPFEPIGTVEGCGTCSQASLYHFTDPLVYTGQVYYSLSQTDFNGVTTNLSMLAAPECNVEESVLVSPNPGSGNFSVQVTGYENEPVSFELLDPVGRLLMSQNMAAEKGQGQRTLNFDLSEYSSGVFLLRTIAGSDCIVTRIVLRK